ncbi:PspC domain-containing protein [Reichenbachiella agariperforans]|uniref:Phage shock protein C (PspC) family protein n=1 Tax=Reichenbachiella agariperforans TaxID=156994 RepID=A0A1M6VHD8_REIAG|nr:MULTISPECIES: PspC domain-containing protein [Reichenbachiella]SHK80870.1 phage shock protein C (PspC) family protein [Reichenbachiella agariperforans]
MKGIQDYFEKHAFGVCARLGEKLRLPSSSIRLFFIYASFLAFGSPLIVYLSLAFVMNFRKHLRRRHSLWYY